MDAKFLNLAISPTKADRLFWLGRYSERAALSLHLICKYCNAGPSVSTADELAEFARRMGVPFPTDVPVGVFVNDFLYSDSTPVSLAKILSCAKNNAMLVRNDIKSETLAYIEMATNYVDSAKHSDAGVFSLQPVSDYLLAFWGAVDENVLSRAVRNLLMIGRYIERLDIMVRFDYDAWRIGDTLSRLEAIDESELSLCDSASLAFLRKCAADSSIKHDETLARLNSLFAA